MNYKLNVIEMVNEELLQVNYLAKVYYQFPQGFQPSEYLDYLKYVRYFEFTNQYAYE